MNDYPGGTNKVNDYPGGTIKVNDYPGGTIKVNDYPGFLCPLHSRVIPEQPMLCLGVEVGGPPPPPLLVPVAVEDATMDALPRHPMIMGEG